MNERINEQSESRSEHEHAQDGRRDSEGTQIAAEESKQTSEEKPHHNHAGNHTDHDHHAMMVADFRRRFWISLVLTVPILVLSPMIQEFLGFAEAVQFPGDLYALFAFSTAVFFYGGWPFLTGLLEELHDSRPGMMTLIGVAITTAYVYSSAVVFGVTGTIFFWELATLIDVMLVGHWIEMRSVMGASRALEELAQLMPDTAHKVLEDGSTKEVPVEELAHEDRVLIKPGEKIPADGTILEGESSVNEAMITGESTPVPKAPGEEVIGGSINGEGSLTISVEKTGEEGYLSQVIAMVREAQESKSQTQNLANRAALWLTIVALGGGAITLFAWTVFGGADFAFALERTVTVMVIACPHALGLAIPLVVAVSTALSAQNGLLIRNRTAFESARNLEAILFDKTGTLTEGRFGVTDTVLFSESITEDALLRLAAGVETHSEHPIAKGIVEAVDQTPGVEGFQSIPGKGAEGRVNGREVKVVSPGYLREQNIDVDASKVDPLSTQGKTVVFVLVNGELKGAIALADIIREESKEAIRKLEEMGIRPMMLTGDNERVANWVADQIGIEEVFAEVLPGEKADKVKEVQERGLVVGMTGDGVNDAPALAQADVGIAVGAGTDVAVETADIILVRSNPKDVLAILKLSRATYGKMVQNLWWAAGYNIFAIPLAAGVLYGWGILFGPAVGAALMSLSTVIVAVNARFLTIER
jgi:Cu2+-exporting ATPase